jgi:hypothetical protein
MGRLERQWRIEKEKERAAILLTFSRKRENGARGSKGGWWGGLLAAICQ